MKGRMKGSTHVATSKQSWVGIPPNNEKKNKV
jgi:hypothetical protein